MTGILFDITWLIWVFGMLMVIWVVLDFLAPRLLSLMAWLLPDDICGPGGWYVDTADKQGIFDRQSGRNRA